MTPEEYAALAYSNERAYSNMAENTIAAADAAGGKNLLDMAADFLGGANRARKASVASASGQTVEKGAVRAGF